MRNWICLILVGAVTIACGSQLGELGESPVGLKQGDSCDTCTGAISEDTQVCPGERRVARACLSRNDGTCGYDFPECSTLVVDPDSRDDGRCGPEPDPSGCNRCVCDDAIGHCGWTEIYCGNPEGAGPRIGDGGGVFDAGPRISDGGGVFDAGPRINDGGGVFDSGPRISDGGGVFDAGTGPCDGGEASGI